MHGKRHLIFVIRHVGDALLLTGFIQCISYPCLVMMCCVMMLCCCCVCSGPVDACGSVWTVAAAGARVSGGGLCFVCFFAGLCRA